MVRPLPSSEERALTLLEGMALDMVVEGKSPREISQVLGITPAEALKMSYDLLDREVVVDVEQKRRLQVYRLEKIVEALWQRVMKSADRDDVRNLTDVLEKLNTLLGLNKEADAAYEKRMHEYQLQKYLDTIITLITSFMALAPSLMTHEQWQAWTAEQLQSARTLMIEENKS